MLCLFSCEMNTLSYCYIFPQIKYDAKHYFSGVCVCVGGGEGGGKER